MSADGYDPVPSVVSRDVLDEFVLIDTSTGDATTLDERGAAIWSALVDGHDVDAIVAITAKTSGWAPDDVRADVVAFLGQLADLGLVRPQH